MTERNVVLLILDTVRKDVFDERAQMLRERSDISFERAYAPSSWTVPSHASMFTGQLPHCHGVHAHNINFGSLSPSETFHADLDRHTIGLSANSFLSPRFGFDELFDEFDSLHGNEELLFGGIDSIEFLEESAAGQGAERYLNYVRRASAESALLPSLVNAAYMKFNNACLDLPVPRFGDYGAKRVLREGIERARAADPFFLFVNVIDAHAPHEVLFGYDTDVSPKWTSREYDVWEVNLAGVSEFPSYTAKFEELYGCAVEYLDGQVNSFVDEINASTDGETTVIITADHGEEYGKHSERTIGHKLPSAAVSHVPLEIINPPSDWSSGPVTDVVSLLDIGQLVRGIVDNDQPDIARSVAPVERIGDPSPPEERRDFWDRGIRTCFLATEAYEWDTLGSKIRYRVSRSREELTDVEAEIPQLCHECFAEPLTTAKEFAKSSNVNLGDQVDDSTRRRLQDLGYMG